MYLNYGTKRFLGEMPMSDTRRNPIMVIGLDGGEWNIIRPLIERGVLPNLEKMILNGSYGKLKSSIPPITPTAWSSFLTGVNPGKHGIFSYQKRFYGERPYSVSPLNSLDMKKEPLWQTLSRHGKKVDFINVPMSFPPQKVNGNMITGMMTPSTASRFTYPDSLETKLSQRGIDYRIDLKINKDLNQIEDKSFQEHYFGDEATRFFDDLYDLTKIRYEAVSYLIKEHSWDFFMSVFVGMDRIQHFLWDSLESGLSKGNRISEKIFEYYHCLDEIIGNMIREVDDNTTVIIMSDHGFGRYKGDFLINRLLIDLGVFKVKENKHRAISTLKKITRNFGVSKKSLARVFGQDKMESLRMTMQHVDWQETRAFSLLAHGIHINLKEKEPLGCVKAGEEYERLREMLINTLYTIKDPMTGRLVIKKVYKKEEIYSGKELDIAPDLIILSSDEDHYGMYSTKYHKTDMFSENSWKTGDHRQDGILIVNGEGIKNNYKIDNSEIIDLFPTILSFMGLPIPEYVDGKVLTDLLQDPSIEVRYEKGVESRKEDGSYEYMEDEVAAVKERLKQLGYID